MVLLLVCRTRPWRKVAVKANASFKQAAVSRCCWCGGVALINANIDKAARRNRTMEPLVRVSSGHYHASPGGLLAK